MWVLVRFGFGPIPISFINTTRESRYRPDEVGQVGKPPRHSVDVRFTVCQQYSTRGVHHQQNDEQRQPVAHQRPAHNNNSSVFAVSPPHLRTELCYLHLFRTSEMTSTVVTIKSRLLFCERLVTFYTVSALTLSVGQQEGHPSCKKTGCWFVGGDILTGALHVLYLQLSPLTTSIIQ